ncbi:MAG: hypothetical protein L6R39_002954 [Caloplaca ligustica]|nr:MAG: hypothetical protein L6R39_002954 [Caloplaca ligustica]
MSGDRPQRRGLHIVDLEGEDEEADEQPAPRRRLHIVDLEGEDEDEDELPAPRRSPRLRLQAILNQVPDRYSPRRKLRQVLSQVPVQDQVFGDDSPGGLTWDDYSNLQPFVGPVLREQGKTVEGLDRDFPLRCREQRLDENGVGFQCDESEDVEVRRCIGVPVDQGAVWGRPNPNFPGTARLRYLRPHDKVKRWDAPPKMWEHKRPAHPVCEDCLRRNWIRRVRVWSYNFPHDSDEADGQRWFRLCKTHSTQARDMNLIFAWQSRWGTPYDYCGCATRSERLWSCDYCQDEAQIAWNDRAQYWKEELMHTHKRQGRFKKPYVDRSKRRRAEPACAWKDCGSRGWYGTNESDRSGVSVCLACSCFVVA